MGHRLSSSRRELLSTLSGTFAVGLVAGCSGQSDGSDATRTATEGEPSPTATASPTSEASPTPRPELDLREANVVDVAFDAEGDRYTFDVTLHHDDEGEDGYANWWQVERLDGTRLGRRELRHAHADQPFTRSDTIEISSAVTCVVVRGHDQTHGYGGRLLLVDLASGETRTVEQGPDRQSVSERECPGS
ncbi:hypothetical protein [Halobellus clavatus]|jgi:hypothetical protein|uniref:Uncharacterized protein n=1 Tax=Halobellus clavatus TaxID=660517 RepID=A0A1H3EH56_9EURY|nr:hypothetical protein [Halobellus clavatus]SDX77950.1 hypothetical protein SAMN04487946_102279 [Halobellus clavatus]